MAEPSPDLPHVRLKSGRILKVIANTHTEESRKAFDKLNSQKPPASVHVRKRSAAHVPPIRNRDTAFVFVDSDTDIVNVKVGNVSGLKVNNGGGDTLGPNVANLHIVFWGEKWTKNPPTDPSMDDILSDLEALLASTYFAALGQYGVTGTAKLADAWISHRGPPHLAFTMIDVNYQCWLLMTSGPIPDDPSSVVCLVCPPGATPSDSNENGEHDHSLQPNFVWVPTIWIQYESRATMSQIFSHELAETFTDPNGDGIQIDPTSSISWNEICDVCENVPTVELNGVTVQSYWSAQDNACVVPTAVPVVARQITCISKRTELDDPKENIQYVGGVHVPSGFGFRMYQRDVITRIENGEHFFVMAPDGQQAQVIVRTHFPPWAPQGTKYITTAADNTTADNLLSLPRCK
jgi:hypothetical protein